MYTSAPSYFVHRSKKYSSVNEMLSESSIVTQAKEQVSVDLDGETVILNLKGGIYYGLKEAGAVIWEMLQEPISVEKIRDAILAEYEVEADRCKNDLLALLQKMTDAGLVEVNNEAAV